MTRARHPYLLAAAASILLAALWAAPLWAGQGATAPSAPAAPTGSPEGDFTLALVKALGGLALVLALVVGLYVLSRRFFPGAPALGGGNLKVRGRMALGARKQVVLLEVAGKVLVLGVSQDRINLLTTLDDADSLQRPATPAGGGFRRAFKKAAARQEEGS